MLEERSKGEKITKETIWETYGFVCHNLSGFFFHVQFNDSQMVLQGTFQEDKDPEILHRVDTVEITGYHGRSTFCWAVGIDTTVEKSEGQTENREMEIIHEPTVLYQDFQWEGEKSTDSSKD